VTTLPRVDGLLRRFVRSARPPDPFATLELQCRLSRLAGELRDLERAEPQRFAAAHHMRAALWAYDRTLEDALRMMRLPVPEGGGPVARLLAETSLRSVGWTW
jgi:hypothetical protein